MPYAVVVGEALVDLFESECDGEMVYRPMVGGAPLNVAAGIARLGLPVEFVGSVSVDVLGERIWRLLTETGIGTRGSQRVGVPTTLAVTSLRDGVPEFHFYGEPPSFALLDGVDREIVAGAGVLYCGSIALMYERTLAAARAAWSVPGPLRTLDPNARPTLLADPAGLRAIIEEFAATADLVKLSEPDAEVLFGLSPAAAAAHLTALGATAVVVTLGKRGALAQVGDDRFDVPAPAVEAVDTTGAGDAAMAALMVGLLQQGPPTDANAWQELVSFATAVAAYACETRGGATAMPTMDAVRVRMAQTR